MSMKKLAILFYLLNWYAQFVAQIFGILLGPNEKSRITFSRLIENHFEDLVHGQ
jgi:hypothetical protein